MIYKKVPEVNDEVIDRALRYVPNNLEEVDDLFQKLVNKHHPKTIANQQRRNSLWELVNLYYYFKETQPNNPEYHGHMDTMKEMLFDGGLITDYKAGFPISQFTNRSIERYAAEAIIEAFPGHSVIMHRSGGRNDNGIDFLWNGKKVDIKSAWQEDYISPNSNLGSIKDRAISDPTKETDLIVWTANMVNKGYICLVGVEQWSDVKEQIKNGEWQKYYKKGFNLDMYKKKVEELNKDRRFDTKFLGNISEKDKNKMISHLSYMYESPQLSQSTELKTYFDIADKISNTPVRDIEQVDTNMMRATLIGLQKWLKNVDERATTGAKVYQSIYKIQAKNEEIKQLNIERVGSVSMTSKTNVSTNRRELER